MGWFKKSDRIMSRGEERRLNAGADSYIRTLSAEVEAQLHPGEFLLGGPVSNMQKLVYPGEIWWVTDRRIGVQRGPYDTIWYERDEVKALQVELRNGVAVVNGSFGDGQSATASFMEQADKMAAYLSKFVPSA